MYVHSRKEPSKENLQNAENQKKECDKNTKQSCEKVLLFLKGHHFHIGDSSRKKDKDLTVDISSKLCIFFKDKEYCKEASQYASNFQDVKRSLEICRRSEDPDACFLTAQLIFSQKEVKYEAGLEALAFACSKPDEGYCEELYKKSFEAREPSYLNLTCKANVGWGCFFSGIYQREMNSDPRLREKLYSKACSLGVEAACDLLKTIGFSMNLYDCNQKRVATSCFNVAIHFIQSDIYESRKFADLGCKYNHLDSCALSAEVDLQIMNLEEQDDRRSDTIQKAFSDFGNSLQQNRQAPSVYQPGGGFSNSYAAPGTSSSGTFSCGLKPLPKLGCVVGRCVNGDWEQVCNSSSGLTCGLKPLPQLGCRVGGCVDGAWEQVCDASPVISCGLKPLPHLGCKIGRCVNGSWEHVCN